MKRHKNHFWTAFITGCCMMAMMAAAPAGSAQMDPRLTDILVTGGAGEMLLYARLADGFKKEMEDAILAGVPAVFTIELDVYEERPYLWDRHILRREIRRTIKYDNLKKNFLIATNGLEQPAILPNFESAQKSMAELNGIPVVSLSNLTRGERYYAQVRVKIDRVRLPFKMEYVLFFVSLWDFETPLYKIRFAYE
ncbi:MAG: DUF4390 domain-containing protein [Smithellaceae bacterium]|jgi:hypothetical protein|nr:DUF4390 domain-containing protein [Smithellaceae bacterium]MDD3259238.1 DUF4390 domain-containing protein [Smithellaceae bacterium]MDD3849241.1 DUF4390 domain-containing protein [Smithellaceae bacterium]HOG13417.1 DUF4390 domain-containing protein [Smithellaceae bacterium]HPL09604.1 DUF4390 domain-containing protein [Smithellaceae bacterium]